MAMSVLECLAVGPLQVNCYLVGDPETRDAVCIDPGDEAERIIEAIERRGVSLQAVLITHAHADHIVAAPEVSRATGVPVLAPDGEQELWSHASDVMAFFGFPAIQPDPPDRWIEAGAPLRLGSLEFQALDVRGHSPAALAYVAGDMAFVGDALFAGSIGRTDLPGQDHGTLIDRILTNLLTLPPNTRVYPGHGPATTIAREAAGNPFLQRAGAAPEPRSDDEGKDKAGDRAS